MKWAVVLLAACNAQAPKKLRSASTAPAAVTLSAQQCGVDVSNGSAPLVRYRYTYDQFNRLSHATGHYNAGGPDDEIDYTYDHLDHLTDTYQSRGGFSETYEVRETYDTLGDLIDYTTASHGKTYNDVTSYTYADLTASGQPKTEDIVDNGTAAGHYLLTYDTTNRLVAATLAGGETTTYTYDDEDTRTLTVDTDNGGYHGIYNYDDQNRELSELWGGTASDAQHSATTYEYSGDQLVKAVYQTGAPLVTTEIDTPLYSCDTP